MAEELTAPRVPPSGAYETNAKRVITDNYNANGRVYRGKFHPTKYLHVLLYSESEAMLRVGHD